MKKFFSDKKGYIAAALIACAVLTVAAAALGAGTADDPLVTLSYINGTYRDEILRSLMDSIDDKFLSEIKEQVRTEIYSEVLGDLKAKVSSGDVSLNAGSSYEVIVLKKGQSLSALGACEIILRSGSAKAFVELKSNKDANVGLSDCTNGSEITDGKSIPQRHLIIIPRGDGRGAVVTSGEAYFMVRGEYEVK